MTISRFSLTTLAASLALTSLESSAQSNLNISAVIDGYYQQNAVTDGLREDGFNLGHSEIALSAPIDDTFYGKLTTVLASHDGAIELEVEEAFIQTTALPGGFGIRAGRLLSDVGYLNNQHLHTDAFAERPVAYRAMLGSHYSDDGIRINWIAPTALYFTVGAELFAGDTLALEETDANVGVMTLHSKIGGDIGTDSSWQMGAAYLRNENGKKHLADDLHPHTEPAGVHDDHHDHDDHGHGAAYGGRDMAIFDATFKWAPNGNYKYQSLALSAELLIADDLYEDIDFAEQNSGWYVAGIYQINPNWSVASRYGEFEGWSFHEFVNNPDGSVLAEFEVEKTTNTSLSLGWHPSHFSVVRLFATKEKITGEESLNTTVVGISFNTALGAHGAHAF